MKNKKIPTISSTGIKLFGVLLLLLVAFGSCKKDPSTPTPIPTPTPENPSVSLTMVSVDTTSATISYSGKNVSSYSLTVQGGKGEGTFQLTGSSPYNLSGLSPSTFYTVSLTGKGSDGKTDTKQSKLYNTYSAEKKRHLDGTQVNLRRKSICYRAKRSQQPTDNQVPKLKQSE